MKWKRFMTAVHVDLAAACWVLPTTLSPIVWPEVLVYNILPDSELHAHVCNITKLHQGCLNLARTFPAPKYYFDDLISSSHVSCHIRVGLVSGLELTAKWQFAPSWGHSHQLQIHFSHNWSQHRRWQTSTDVFRCNLTELCHIEWTSRLLYMK